MLSALLGRSLAIFAGLFAITGACSCGSDSDGVTPLQQSGRPQDGDAGPGGNGGLDGSPGAALPESCKNGSKDGDETDVDCGGSVCARCAQGGTCVAATDCVAQLCSGGKCNGDIGCSDGTREGFAAVDKFPGIAACAGAWSIGGLLPDATKTPACGGASGNDSQNPTGAGCNVADLCQVGWHVCTDPADVGFNSKGAGCAAAGITGTAFFAVRQSGPGGAMCGAGTNDLFGCGDTGAPADVSCAPLDKFSHDLCSQLPNTWSCGPDSAKEADNVTKTAVAGGGVLCCRH